MLGPTALPLALAGAMLAASAAAETPEPYVPGLGDFMTAYVQPHHVKLWLSGSARNWPLARYEADELSETFEDVVSYQGKWHDLPVASLVKDNIDPALAELGKAIDAKDEVAFRAAYLKLNGACNACHQAADHGFIVIQSPIANAYPDQNFLTPSR